MKKSLTKISIALLAIAFIGIDNLNAQTYNINTIAGNGIEGYFGDGGAATAAELNYPHGVAIDAVGNVYIADYQNNRIRKINTSGIITTIAGNGTGAYSGDGGVATAAELDYPTSVTVDASGNLYIADYLNAVIRKVTTSGIISTIAGNGTVGYSGDGGNATAAELNAPTGVDIDASGNIYIVDLGNNRIRKVSTFGIITTVAGNGTAGYSGDGGTATAAELNSPTDVTTDASGNVYFADYGNNRIRKINTSGLITTIAGNGTAGYSGDSGAATIAMLNDPHGLAVDASSDVYFADTHNNCIRKISTSGIISTIAGDGIQGYSGDGGAATAAELNSVMGVAIDASGNLYIADYGNYRIRKLTPITTGIATLSESNNASLYPNPTNTIMNLSFAMQGSAKKATINILDITGKSMLETTTDISNGKTIPIDISSLSAGIYFVRITTDKTTQVVKFVKENK